jgi:hypothetical protein
LKAHKSNEKIYKSKISGFAKFMRQRRMNYEDFATHTRNEGEDCGER